MSDREFRVLERTIREAPDDTGAWIRYVAALDQLGTASPEDLAERVRRVRSAVRFAPAHVGIEEGDEVWVEETETPWIIGRWRGWVTKVWFAQDPVTGADHLAYRVRPDFGEDDGSPLAWRVRPLPDQRARGLELGTHVKLELIAKKTDPWPRVFG